MKTAHLFAGAGGGILADLILEHEPVLAIELDPRRCALLELRYPGLEVVCGDATRMDYSQWHGRVDHVSAGVPCPRWSSARRGAGLPPDLSDEPLRFAAEAGVRTLFLESVPGFAREWPRLRVEAKRLGYTLSQPLILGAAAVGAPHIRDRAWISGYADEICESVEPQYAKVGRGPSPDSGFWDATPPSIPLADGVARPWEMGCAGDGQVPLQAAAAWIMLGLPYSPELLYD